ncbi:hypothetical protein ELE36_16630 [Pseudolysobacter antarcticus]|uniref:Uncharacterized protein n=1 Tax=Pseudolysobacter antarcticus TaxID=2511995 RepID=A0A411HMZ2_9GAMM|nr:hypothetical protein [Pseudolysobacter antarcticus]QBB71849.1 hypothetical protein ELE36_16630 [Pseudolysobacter antarcticus]
MSNDSTSPIMRLLLSTQAPRCTPGRITRAAAPWLVFALSVIGVLISANPALALSVTQPSAATVIAAGDDYATQVLGNAWDMSDAVDIDTEESGLMSSQVFSAGIFSGATTGNGASIYPLFMGYSGSINLSRGANFPIATSHYRYVTIKLRVHSASQNVNLYFLLEPNSYSTGTYGASHYFPLVANQWTTVTIDMINDVYPAPTSGIQWTDQASITGLRIDPANGTGVSYDIDWIRLTAPATTAQKTSVQWTDSGYTGTYKIEALDIGSAPVSYTLAAAASGTSYLADTTFLAPGQYQIKVTRNGDSTTASSATFRINNPAQIALTSPSVRGEQAQNFASVVVGNSWGPPPSGGVFSATDFLSIVNFSNVSYTNPAGTFSARPTNNDPNLRLNQGGHTIDPTLYRSLCFTMQVSGARNVGLGSVARFFWSSNGTNLTTSGPIVLDTGLSEYCMADLATVQLDNTAGGTWLAGSKILLRLDPHEFPVSSACTSTPTPASCYDVQLNSVVLSPFAQANPGYTFTWNLADADNTSATLNLYLDPDNTPGNGNEIAIGSVAANNGNGQLVWPGSSAIQYGTYHVLVVADDGVNSVSQYAGGVIVIGARDGIFRNGFEN